VNEISFDVDIWHSRSSCSYSGEVRRLRSYISNFKVKDVPVLAERKKISSSNVTKNLTKLEAVSK